MESGSSHQWSPPEGERELASSGERGDERGDWLRYVQVWLIFASNSLVRNMSFRWNFVLECLTSMAWALMNIGFYLIVFAHVDSIGATSGWGKLEFFIFLGTTWLINALMQAFVMPNAEELSELIRTGGLDFALLKPIDTQFLISFRKVEWSSLSNVVVAGGLLGYALWQLRMQPESVWRFDGLGVVAYPIGILCGVAIMYSVVMVLAATSIWLGRNQSLYDFWFYITNFSRYPMEIYQRGWGLPLWWLFTFAIPVLLVVNVPARLLARPLWPRAGWEWWLAGFMLLAAAASVWVSRWVFQRALSSYRSASS